MNFNNLLNAITTEQIIGIVAVIAIVLSVFAIVFTAVRNFVKVKKAALKAEADKTEILSQDNEIVVDATVNEENALDTAVAEIMDETVAEQESVTVKETIEETEEIVDAIEEQISVAEDVEPKEDDKIDAIAENTAEVENKAEAVVVSAEPSVETAVTDVVEPISVNKTEKVAAKSVKKTREKPIVETAAEKGAVKAAEEIVATVSDATSDEIDLTGFEKSLVDAGAETVELYNLLKNYFLSFNLARSSASTNFDTYKVNKDIIARLIFVKEKLTVCLPIDPKDSKYGDKKFAHDDLSENGTYAKVPFALTIRCGLNARRCIELFEQEVIYKFNLVKNDAYTDVDYSSKYLNAVGK